MKNISEILSIFNTKIVFREQVVKSFINAANKISNLNLKPEDIIIKGKEIVINARVSGPIKTSIILKKKDIINETNKTPNVEIKNIY